MRQHWGSAVKLQFLQKCVIRRRKCNVETVVKRFILKLSLVRVAVCRPFWRSSSVRTVELPHNQISLYASNADLLSAEAQPPGTRTRLLLACLEYSWEHLESISFTSDTNEIAKTETSYFGTKYVIEGVIFSPDRRNPSVRSVWFIESGSDIPFFVTAYPLKGK